MANDWEGSSNQMRILVTGRHGQVSQSLRRELVSHSVTFVGRPSFDLSDTNSIERVIDQFQPDLVISAAAYTAVDAAEDEPEVAFAVNGEAPGSIGRAAAKVGASVIHLSTDYVFDGSKKAPYIESDQINPVCVYGRSKAAGEQSLRQSGAHFAILRCSWIFSEFGSNFVKTMLRLAMDRDQISVVSDQIGCPTYASDIARSIAVLTEAWARDKTLGGNETYHFAGQSEVTWAELATEIFAQSKKQGGPFADVLPISTADYPTRTMRPENSRLNSEKFLKDFGFMARSLQDALPEVIQKLV